MKKKLNTLTELDAAEVSLVKSGANQKKRFPISKSEDSMDIEEILKAVLETKTDKESELAEFIKTLDVSEKGAAAATGALRLLASFHDEMPEALVKELQTLAGYEKAKEKKAEEEDDEEEEFTFPSKKKKGDVKKWFEAMPEELQEHFDLPEDQEDVVMKELSPEMTAVLKAQKDELEVVRKQNEDFQKQLKVEKDARELASWTQKAKEELSHFPGKSTDELGQILKDLNDVNPDMATTQFASMKSASDALKQSGLLEQVGKSVGGTVEGSAWAKIKKQADGIVEKSSDIDLTKEAAIAKVLDRRPDLYNEYLSENPAQAAKN